MNYSKTKLANGLTVITIPIQDAPSVTVLTIVHTGSKYETKEISGLSHFLEHMCFKGTEKRPKAAMISLEFDKIGSQSNAFTGQELTGYYAKAHPKHVDTIIDLISDIYLHPIFEEAEIEKEKGVIVEEISMYEDIPQHVVSDLFVEALYGDQPAGWNVGGTKENVRKMTKNDFIEYRKKHYVAEGTTVIVSGNFDEAHILSQIKEKFSSLSLLPKEDKVPVKEEQHEPIVKIKQKTSDQTHLILGVRSFSAKDEKSYALRVLSVVLGGGMSSRLFQKLREEMGAGYYVRAGVDEYTDHGFFAVSTGTEARRIPEVIRAILDELKKVTLELIPEDELQKAKDYMLGNMFLGLEGSDSLAEYYAVQEVLTGNLKTPTEYAERIQQVTSEEIRNVAKEIMKNESLVAALVGKIEDEETIKHLVRFS